MIDLDTEVLAFKGTIETWRQVGITRGIRLGAAERALIIAETVDAQGKSDLGLRWREIAELCIKNDSASVAQLFYELIGDTLVASS